MSRAERGALLRPESPQFPPSNAINARLARHNPDDTKAVAQRQTVLISHGSTDGLAPP
jgi:hypothetical protein